MDDVSALESEGDRLLQEELNGCIIDPNSGHIDAYLDLTGLKARNPMGDVLNGIAYEPQTHRLLVTGKLWSEIYEIEIVKKP